MATVCCRALYVVKWYEVSRVLSVSSTLAATKSYRNETWCKRWWHISQRNLSLTTSKFAPSLSPILAKGMRDSKSPKSETSREDAADVAIMYHRGLLRIKVPLPSRKEKCMFNLKPITHTVGDLIGMLKGEDRGIDRAAVTTIDGVRISSSNTIGTLMEDDFRLIINDVDYVVSPPLHDNYTMENEEKLWDVKTLIGQLYESFHIHDHYVEMEKQVLAELEDIKLQLDPIEKKLQQLEVTAARRANIVIWVCLVLMSVQFSSLARLTWWEYSWDIMEPITYFVTYGTTMLWFIYFVLTRQEYMLVDVVDRQHLLALHKKAKKAGFELDRYNELKERYSELESTLKIIRGPLFDYKVRVEQKKRESSSSSRSKSKSRSSSPSSSPSPEKSLPKKEEIPPERNTAKKPVPEETRFSSPWTDKDLRGY